MDILVARKYENNYQGLVSKLLCGTTPESLPRDNKIWIEAYLQPTRQDERDSWKVRADLAIGHLEVIKRQRKSDPEQRWGMGLYSRVKMV